MQGKLTVTFDVCIHKHFSKFYPKFTVTNEFGGNLTNIPSTLTYKSLGMAILWKKEWGCTQSAAVSPFTFRYYAAY